MTYAQHFLNDKMAGENSWVLQKISPIFIEYIDYNVQIFENKAFKFLEMTKKRLE